MVNGFIAAKQDALFGAPDAYYRSQGRDALDGAPAIAQRLQDLRAATLEQARDDGERAALGPRLDAHLDDAMDGIGRHVAAQRQVFQRNTLGTRQALIQRAAQLEHDNDDKIAGLAEAHAGAALELARLDGVDPDSAQGEATNVPSGAPLELASNLPDDASVQTDGQSPLQGADPNLVLAADGPDPVPSPGLDGKKEDVELAQAKPSQQPVQKAQQNQQKLERWAKIEAKHQALGPLPPDWEKRLSPGALATLYKEADTYKVPPEMLAAMIWIESQFAEGASASDKAQGKGLLGVSNIAIKELIRQNGNNPTRKTQLEEWEKGMPECGQNPQSA